MPKYQELIYGSGATYGEASRVAFSAEPVTATAVSHSSVELTWAKPLNTSLAAYVGFRVVRNQDAFPENEEDGVILYEFYTKTAEVVDKTSFIDGKDVISGMADAPLVSGRFCYYRAWILLDEAGEWVRAGDAYTLLPSDHASGTGPSTVLTGWTDANGDITDYTIGNQHVSTTHDRLMEMIPSVFLSANKGPLDAIQEYDSEVDASGADENTLLNQYLKAFSLTFDEFLNYAEFVSPEVSGKNTDPNILELQSQQLNLSFDTSGISRSQKKLVREALYIYRRKGTLNSLQTAVEAITGYDAVVTESTNLMLSPQDSTFFYGTGFWNAGTGCTIAATNAVFATNDISLVPSAIDFDWSANVKVTVPDASIYNGYTSPTTRGIPVRGGTGYTLSFYANFDDTPGSSDALATPAIKWFDRNGKEISTSTIGPGADCTGDWVRRDLSVIAPSNAVYAGISVSFNLVSDRWFVDMFTFVNSAVPTFYEEARGVNVFLSPKKTNLFLDPSFEGDLSSWQFDNGTATAVPLLVGGIYDGPMGARAGLKKLNFVSGSTGESSISSLVASQVPGDRFYTFSFYAKADEDVTSTITLLDSNGEDTSKNIEITTEWQRFFVTHYYKTPVASSGLTATILGADWAGATIQVDCAQLEDSYYPTDYFDGSLTLTGGAWLGGSASANAARSYYYPSVSTKLTRLANEIEKFMPLNTPYIVSMYRNDGSMVPPKGIS